MDRISSDSWQRLVLALNQLPEFYRICLLSSQSSRAAGLLWRTRDVMENWQIGDERQPWRPPTPKDWNPLPQEDREELIGRVERIADGNISVSRQLSTYLTWVIQSNPPADVFAVAKDHLTALELPRPIATHPVALLERISRLLVAQLEPSKLADVRTLALLDEPDARLIQEICEPATDPLLKALVCGSDTTKRTWACSHGYVMSHVQRVGRSWRRTRRSTIDPC